MQFFLHHRSWFIAVLVGFFGSLQAQAGLASSFEVAPIRVAFSPTERTTLMTVSNEGDERIRLQINVMAWDQNKAGEMLLTPTDDIIFYPTLLTIDPGAKRNLRLGTNGGVVTKEQTYRVSVEELPSNVKIQGTGVRIVTKMSIPIFVKPPKMLVNNVIDRIALRGSDLTFDLVNKGNVHMQPREVRVRGMGPDGALRFERKIPGWYVLAGGMREYRIDIPKAECQKIKDLTVEVDLQDKPLRENFAVPSGACAR
jgi:fimbrial chaperone protein